MAAKIFNVSHNNETPTSLNRKKRITSIKYAIATPQI